jgi:hypothetical protein
MNAPRPVASLLFLALLVPSACSGVIGSVFRKAAEPTGGDRARLRVVSNGFVKAIPGKGCIDWSAPGAGTVFGGRLSSSYRGRSLNMPGTPLKRDDSAELYVEAAKPIVLEVVSNRGIYSCQLAVTFTPEAGKDYEARMVHVRERKFCEAQIVSLTDPQETVPISAVWYCR